MQLCRQPGHCAITDRPTLVLPKHVFLCSFCTFLILVSSDRLNDPSARSFCCEQRSDQIWFDSDFTRSIAYSHCSHASSQIDYISVCSTASWLSLQPWSRLDYNVVTTFRFNNNNIHVNTSLYVYVFSEAGWHKLSFKMPVTPTSASSQQQGQFRNSMHDTILASCLIYSEPKRHTSLPKTTTPWLAAQAMTRQMIGCSQCPFRW